MLHEYSHCPQAHTVGQLDAMTYVCISGQGARSANPLKFLQDAALLEEALLHEPNHPRHQFYLAQSYRDAGLLEQDQLLQAIGHRGVAEMELAEPRWQEVPDRSRREVERLAVRPSGAPIPACPKELELAQRWVGLRERARHWLMFGWAELRRTLLVVETGGVLSHGAIVARELGLPAVANIPIGELRSGMRLRVDGEKGEVLILQG